MAKLRLLLFTTMANAVGVAAGDSLGDFSNDLATDLGPLLALFGDAMTRQYLSESTSFLDYLIFAMAPIGILTAIVSTIRVCGHSSLRAFVGRSQEGEGVIEAELCTSTSRDVCELFNRGGIARVLGKPSVLELVYDPSKAPSVSGNPDDSELRLSRKYFEGMKSSDDWQRVEGSVFERPSKTEALAEDFAPNPNLSLNVGIVKRPKWVFVAIAATGVILQAGVVVLAGVGVWVLKWNLNSGGEPASRDYAPIMFISGTVVMCAGMWACAYLIGQSTHEVRFRRRGKKPAGECPRLFWLQPGPQVIGDQSFDPYGHVEDTEHAPHGLWMSSRKHFDETLFEINTILAISAVTLGYIAQFIGLRGMKAWVALAQLAVTLLMSFLRGCLRMQRLGKKSNQLGHIPDLVSGHELDWLSFKIAQQNYKLHVTGHYDDTPHATTEAKESTRASKNASHDTKSESMEASILPISDAPLPISDPTKLARIDDIQHLLQVRKRLAHLTGHASLERLSSSEYQMWKDDDIKVRAKANQISTALCRIAEKLFGKSRQTEINLRIQVGSQNIDENDYTNQIIDIVLKKFSPSSQRAWIIDSAKIEAILSLWLWTMTYDSLLQKDADASQNAAKDVVVDRIVSASPDDQGWFDRASRAKGEINLWLGPNSVKFQTTTVMVKPQESYGLASLWRWRSAPNEDPYWENLAVNTDDLNSPLHRMCGWTSVPLAEREPQSICKLRVQFVELHATQASLLDICAQELFTTLVKSLGSLLPFNKAIVTESAGTGRLENQTVETIANEFVQSGLGSYPEALLCIIPGFKGDLPSPTPRELLSLVIETADNFRRNQEWNRADILLRWVCTYFSSPGEDHGISFEQVAREFAKHGILQGAHQKPSSPPLRAQPKILAAHYGGQDITILAKWQFCDGEDIVIPTHEQELPIADPWMYTRKSVSVVYRFDDGEIRGFVVPQDTNRTFTLTVDRRHADSENATFVASNYISMISSPIHIHAVIWGLEQVDDRQVYEKLYKKFAKKESVFLHNDFFKKDGWVRTAKTAAVVYSSNGTTKCISGRENTHMLFAY
ncbi:hypothetical protein B0J13DRAFT_557998 [Dactylonectria estremocensis]|uniref:Uncharacterized protein n=1 Tax=Dactylonectria estremocensis TaxID=1079267 RepID=A0A9P9ENU3_9HYPO|nr:hypothetical protein B0J13DRAFT_557998 [Dactylonectria estremocensis]